MKMSVVLLVAALLAGSLSAIDLVVGPPGSGAPFTSIAAAVTVAQAGDRVLVLAGSYTGAVVVNAPIEIVGAGSAVTSSRTYATLLPGLIPTPIVVGNLPAGTRARISGITFGTIGTMAFQNLSTMTVHDCQGRVELIDVVLEGAGLPALDATTAGGILHARDCAQVAASGVQALGSPMSFPIPVPGDASLRRGHAGILVERSSLWLNDCQADGKATRFVSTGFGGDGGPGLRAVDASLHLGESVMRGGQSGGRTNGVIGFGGPAMELIGATALVHGGAPNALYGAAAFEAGGSGIMGFGLAGCAVALDATSGTMLASDVALVPGSGSATLPAAPAAVADAGAIVVMPAERLPTVSLSPGTAPLGGALTVTLTGQPNLPHLRAVALQTSAAFQFSGVWGALLVDVPLVLAFEVVTLGPAGTFTLSVPVPPDPALAGISVVEQAAQVLPIGIALSPPAIVSVGF